MWRSGTKFVVLALVAALAVPLSAQTKHKRARPKKAAVREQAPAPPPTPAPPPEPLRPEQMAPTPPQVTLQNNQLTIIADNSTLSSILSAVRARTGATLDMPRDVANDRVAVRLGPGDPRDVVAELLHGSRFDYVLLSSESDPNALSQIILTARSGAAGAPATAVTGPGARPAAAPPPPSEEEDTADTQPEPQPAPPAPQPPAAGSPVAPPPNAPEIAPPAATESQANPEQPTTPQVRTPEQLLQELQRMQQQQQQNQQQPNRPPGRRQPPPE